MADAVNTVEAPVEELEKEDFFKWVAQGIRGMVKSDEPTEQPEAETEPEVAEVTVEEEEETQPEVVVEEEPVPEPQAKSNDLGIFKTQIEALVKTNEQMAKRLEATEKALADERAKSEEVELQKAEQTFVQKAERMPNVSTKPSALGKALHAAHRHLDEENYMEIEQALTRAEHLLKQAKVWDEFGTTEIPQDNSPLAKAKKIAKEQSIPFNEAVLQLDYDEQSLVLADSRGGV